MGELFASAFAFTMTVAAFFLGGWLLSCFVALEWSVPLESAMSRLWLCLCAIIVAFGIKEW